MFSSKHFESTFLRMGLQEKTVVIIGAGISGLKAASKLYEGGVKNCVILEARNRIGGRLYTVTGYKGRKYDLGASWHHDTLVNRLFLEEAKLASSEKSVNYVFDDDYAMLIDDFRGRVDSDEDLLLEILDDELASFVDLEYRQKLGTPDCSFHDIILKYLFEKRQFLSDAQMRYLPQVSRFLELWHGISWKDMSAKDSFFGHQGRNAFVLHYDKIVNRVASTFPKDWIKLGNEVQSVKRDDTVVVTTKDMEQYKADYVIVTVPQSILKLSLDEEARKLRGGIEFLPALNQNIRNAFKTISYGSLGKVVFEFETCCWSIKTTKIVTLAHSSENIVSRVRSANSWEQLVEISNNDSSDGACTAWDHPLFFVNLAKSTGVPSFVMLMQEPLTRYIETLANDKDRIYKFFEPVLNKIMTTLGAQKVENQMNYSGNKKTSGNVPILKNIISTNWGNDPYSRGAYSASSPGDDPIDMVTALENGQDSRIRFAGEHTIMDGAGCAYGAYESGIREASYVLENTKHC